MNPFFAGRTAGPFLIKLGTLGTAALLVAARFSIPAQANTYNVTGTADGPGVITPIVPGTFGASTLRAAVNAANAVPGPHTINVPAGTYTLSLGELVIGTNANLTVTVNGVGTPANTIIQHDVVSPVARVFDLDPFLLGGVNVTIQNVTIAHGRNNDGFGGAGIICGFQGPPAADLTTISNCFLIDNLVTGGASGAVGGAIQNIGGTLIVNNCRFDGNSAGNFSGGAIYYDSHSPSLGGFQVSNSLFTNNAAADIANGGGAVFAAAVAGSSPFSVTGSSFVSNRVTSATGNGGAIIKFGAASMLISNCVFLGNLVLGNSPITNSASGGAIDNAGGPLTIQYSRFVGNSTAAPGHGNAVNNAAGSATLSADNNWWAANSGPGPALAGASVSAWIKLNHFANPPSINMNASTALTASFITNSAGVALSPANLSTLIGLPISFSNPIRGSLSSSQPNLQPSATATSSFTAGNIPGPGSADAIVDGAVATAPISIICPAYSGTLSGGATICAGASAPVTVTINSGSGPYIVTLNNGGGSKTNSSPLIFNLAPTSNTTYSALSATDSNNCPVTISGSATINVNPSPVASIVPASTAVCGGSSGNQASAPPGQAGYAWSITNGTLTSGANLQTVTYTAGASGNVTLSVTVSNGFGCTAGASTNIVINLQPTPGIAVSGPICPGAPGNVASGPAGFPSYAWTISNGTITSPTNIQTIQFVAGLSGNVILQLTITSGSGCSATGSANVPILPRPVLASGCSFRTNYFAGQTLVDGLIPATMTMAFDGSNYWSCSGNDSTAVRLARYDSNGVLLATFAAGLDFRSVFTDASCAVLARAYADPTIYRQTAPGVFVSSGVSLSGGLLDSQASVVMNGRGTEYIAVSNGVVSRWDPAGQPLGLVPLQTFGAVAGENGNPQNRGIAAVGDFWLTYNGSGILSVWDTAGNRLMQTTLSAAGTATDSRYSFSYANGKVFIVDSAGGSWRGYDVCAPVQVGVFSTPSTLSWNDDVRAKILSEGSLTRVDTFYANPVPALPDLRKYQSVLIFSDAGFVNPINLGNALADYIDLGGGVAVATFAFWTNNSLAIQGRLATSGYLPFTTGRQTNNPGLTMVKDLPAHPILTGVNSFNGGASSFHNYPVAASPGAILVAHWTDGQALIGTREFPLGRIAGLNFYPPSSTVASDFWLNTTDGGKIMANALMWAGKTPPTILAGPVSQPALPGSNVIFNVVASGPGLLSYQWRKDGTNLPGATTSSLLVNVQTNTTGKYRVVVSNPYGTAFSSAGWLYPSLRFQPPAAPITGAFPLFLANADATPIVPERIPQIHVFSAANVAQPFSNWFQLGNPLLLTNGLLRIDAPGSPGSSFFRAGETLP